MQFPDCWNVNWKPGGLGLAWFSPGVCDIWLSGLSWGHGGPFQPPPGTTYPPFMPLPLMGVMYLNGQGPASQILMWVIS